MSKTIDITTLPGYEDLPDGNYDITVVANKEGYAPSPASQSVSYSKVPDPAVLYETGTQTVKMTWEELESGDYLVFNDGELSGGTNNKQIAGDLVITVAVTSIGEDAFLLCEDITSITIPDSVTSIGDYAFHYCKGLTSINIPNGITSIGDHTFSTCTILPSINIPDSVTTIGNRAFEKCKGLTAITIPAGVTSIGSYALSDCTSLSTVNYAGTMAQWEQVQKFMLWKQFSPFTTVHCTDGDVDV